jgi:hypothetical protein
MTRWRSSSWLAFAAVAGLNLGISILSHVDDPREIRQYAGAWLVAVSAATIVMLTVPGIWQHLHLTRQLASAWASCRNRIRHHGKAAR